jgi:hypothetical protein
MVKSLGFEIKLLAEVGFEGDMSGVVDGSERGKLTTRERRLQTCRSTDSFS